MLYPLTLLLQVYDDGAKIYMVMELMRGGELLDRILQDHYFSEKEAANVMFVLVSEWSGLGYYCSIKPYNVVVIFVTWFLHDFHQDLAFFNGFGCLSVSCGTCIQIQ